MKHWPMLLLASLAAALPPAGRAAAAADPAVAVAVAVAVTVTDGPSIQAAVDARPGEVVHVPAGTYRVDAPVRLTTADSGLVGPGRIVQADPDAPVVVIRAPGVQLRGLTLTRPAGGRPASRPAVVADGCLDLTIDDVRVLDNRAPAGAITVTGGGNVRVSNCLVRNYARVAVDDRTADPDWGYAFACVDGTGIQADGVKGLVVQGNRVVERDLLPTPELKARHGLGRFTKRSPTKGRLMSQQAWDAGAVPHWHQGSAIAVTGPATTENVLVAGNYVENAAQGIDVHADRVTVAGNVVANAAVGVKAMHGSRHTLIVGNQFARIDLWAVGLMPGAASRAGGNADGGSVVADNIISDFGGGHAHWIWGTGRSPIVLERGQRPGGPPLRDVLLSGNVVHDAGRDAVPPEPPRYRWAVMVDRGAEGLPGPAGVRVGPNLFHPGTGGVSNVPLPPAAAAVQADDAARPER